MCIFLAPAAIAAGITASQVALAASLAASAISAGAAYKSGQSQKKASQYNAKMADLQATDSLQRGAAEGADRKLQARRVASAQVEGMSQSGISLNTGTPLALLTETAGLGELDAMTARNNARREAWGLKAGADLTRYEGKMAGRAGTMSAAGTLLGGAANSYYGYKGAAK